MIISPKDLNFSTPNLNFNTPKGYTYVIVPTQVGDCAA